MNFDLLTIGDTGIDEFMEMDDASLHCDVNKENCKISFNYAEKIPVKSFKQIVAGNAANVSMSCTKLGLSTAIYTELGKDANGDIILKTLKENGVDTSYSNQSESTSTNVHPIVVYKGERTIFAYHAKREYKVGDWGPAKFIYYTSISEGFEKFQDNLEKLLEKTPNTIVAMNPGSTQLRTNIDAVRKFLKHVDVLFVNKQEARKILDSEEDIDSLHKKLFDAGVKLSVITDSVNGSSAYDGSEFSKIGMYEDGSKVLDKTGAGDAFASGFLSAMFHGKNAEDAMKWGAINSASVIQQIGATKGLVTKEEVEEKIKKDFFTQPKL